MSDTHHPPVDLGIRRPISFERELAEDAFEILQSYGHEGELELDNYSLPFKASWMIDLQAEDCTDLTFRVKSVPTLLLDADEISLRQPSRTAYDFFVMDIQRGTVPDEIEEATEDDYEWDSYLKVIVNAKDADEVSVRDGKTYQELSGADIQTALYIVGLLRHELRGMLIEDELHQTSENQATGVKFLQRGRRVKGEPWRTFGEFDSTEFMDVSSCVECCAENQACEHNKFTLQ